MSSGRTFSGSVAMNGFRFFWPTQALHPHPSMHSPDNSADSKLKMLETILQQPYHSSYLWKPMLEATLFHLHTLSLQEWPILCPSGNMDGHCLYTSHLQSLFRVRGEEGRGLIHIDNIFVSWFISLAFFLISCTKSSASDVPSAGEHWDSWLLIQYLNPCVFNHLCTINDFAPSNLSRKIRHKSDALLDTIHIVNNIPCSWSSNTDLRRRWFRDTNFLMLNKVRSNTVFNCCFNWQ